MTRRIVLSYLTITAFVLVVLVLPLGRTFASRERERLLDDIEQDADVIGSFVEEGLEGREPVDYQEIVDRYAATTDGRAVVVDVTGTSVADSDDPTGPARDFSTRPEIALALSGQRAEGTRTSTTLDGSIVYVAVPVASGGEVHGAVRITYPTSAVDARVRDTWWRLGLLSASVLVSVTLVGFALARSVTRPVRRLEDAAADLAAGDLTRRVELDRGPPEIRRLAQEFDSMADRLEDLVDAQRAFVADASHQLRTPITALRLRLENLEPALAPDQRPDLEAAIAETARLARLVDGLLALARAEGTRPATTTIDARAIAVERTAVWEPLAAEQDVELAVVAAEGAHRGIAAGGAPAAIAVAGALEQILDNLLANALEVAPPGSTVTVSVAQEPDGRVAVAVSDAGPGLTPEQRARAFDRFWRAPGAPRGGTGLGLSIVDRLAAASGGSAALDEAPGGGLRAVVRLRAAPPAPTT